MQCFFGIFSARFPALLSLNCVCCLEVFHLQISLYLQMSFLFIPRVCRLFKTCPINIFTIENLVKPTFQHDRVKDLQGFCQMVMLSAHYSGIWGPGSSVFSLTIFNFAWFFFKVQPWYHASAICHVLTLMLSSKWLSKTRVSNSIEKGKK